MSIDVLKTLVLHWTLVGKAALAMLACHIGTTLDQRWNDRRAGGCVVKVSARGSEGRRFDTRLHHLF